MHSSNPPEGWENDSVRPLTLKPNFRSLDVPCNSETADPNQPKDLDLFTTAATVLEAISRIHDLPAQCDCGVRFKGLTTERRHTIITTSGDPSDPDPKVRTLCSACYSNAGLPAPAPEESHQTRLIKFASAGGASQAEVAFTVGVAQSTVSRTLARAKRGK